MGYRFVMVVLAMGCGHRSSHGSQVHSKKFDKARMVAQQPLASDEKISGGEGYFPEESGTFSDLLEEEALIQEDPQFGQRWQRRRFSE